MECCCHVSASTPSCNLELLHKLRKQICSTVSSSLATSHEPLAHPRNTASLSLFYSYYFCRCLSELVELVPLPFSRYSDRVYDFSATIPICYKGVFVKMLSFDLSLFHMKITESVTDSSHQDRGLCYLHFPVFFSYIYTLLFCWKIKSCFHRCFPQQIRS